MFPWHYINIFSELKQYTKEYINDEIDWKFVDIYPDNLLEHIKQMYN